MARMELNCFSVEERKDPVIWSMCEHLKDVYSAQKEWVWPRWKNGRIVRYKIKENKKKQFKFEEAPF